MTKKKSQESVIREIKNVLGSLMVNGYPNGSEKITILVLNDTAKRRAKKLLVAQGGEWPYALNVEALPGREQDNR